MAEFGLGKGADVIIGTSGDDAVVATDDTLSGFDQLLGGGQVLSDILELRQAGDGIDDAQFIGVRGFENLEITDTLTATIRLTLAANASAAFSYGGLGGDPTFAPKAYVNASNLTAGQKLILDASGWVEPAGTNDRGLRVSLGAGANDIRLTAFDDRILAGEASLGANDIIDGGGGFDVLVLRDDAAVTLGDAFFFRLTSIEMLRLGNFLPGLPSSGNFRVILGKQSETAGIDRIDSRFNGGNLFLDASSRDQSLIVDGSQGDDEVTGTKGADTIRARGGDDQMNGRGGNDILDGGAGDDRMNGGLGADRMIGGDGRDVYFVDNFGDRVVDTGASGSDVILSSIDFTLGAGVERLAFTGAGDLDGTGNAGDNVLLGNAGDNILNGGAGHDIVSGLGGNDRLVGGLGDDMLFGGAGDDTLIGGLGNDSFDGGAGDDILILDLGQDGIARGGAGIDTVKIDGLGPKLVLSNMVDKVFSGIEKIDMTGGKENMLVVDPASVGSDTLLVKGDIGDSVVIAGNWTRVGSKAIPGEAGFFVEYTNGAATIQVETDITVYASTFDLSTLNGKSGFRLNGVGVGDGAGYSVASAGDVNGDGFDDLIVGAYFSSVGGANSGATYVVFGGAAAFASVIDLGTLNGANGFRLDGEGGFATGYAVSSAGDINGDGFADLVMGAPFAGVGGPLTGVAYVVFGKSAGFAPSIDLSTLTGNAGFRLDGGDASYQAGISVSSAGDFNGDGFADIVVGANSANGGGSLDSGQTYVLFGKADWSGTGTIDLNSMNGTNGIQLNGIADDDLSGRSVSTAGDVNGDGFDDLVIGAYGVDDGSNSTLGAAYVVFGKADWSGSATVDLTTLNGNNGFRLLGAADFDYVGFSVSSAGDINGDGFSDLIVGATYRTASSDGYGSAAYVVFGKAGGWNATENLGALNGANGFSVGLMPLGEYTGESVSSAGDLNGDGFDDLIVGAYGASPDGVTGAGVAYVIYGKSGGFAPNFDLNSINGSNGFRLDGVALGDEAGQSVRAAGDIDGDGFDDLIIGASYGNGGTGAAFVVFGGNFSGKVTHLGTAGNDVLTGTKAAETFVGDRGNDVFFSKGGLDSFQGGAGADTIRLTGAGFRHIDGGNGRDTIQLDGAGINFNLNTIPQAKIEDIERIRITGSGNNTLRLSVLDVLDLSDTSNTLIVDGNAGDVVHRGAGWTATGTTTIGAQTYRVFESGEATLLIDLDVTRLI